MNTLDANYKNKPVILVVDDSLTSRRALATALQGNEYDLSLASSGREGLSMAMKLRPDVILLDVMMPDLSGYDVCRQIRYTPSLSDVPILMVTSLTEREERLKGIASGADDFISKPFDALELNTRIRTIIRLDRYRKLREQNRQLRMMKRDIVDLRNKKAYLQKLAMVDDLTGLQNHRSLTQKGRNEFKRAKRYGIPLSVLMIDVDKFKNINDTLGHGVGSSVLKNLAMEMKNNLREMDIAGRFGGDEFFIILPHTSLNSAQTLAERLRSLIASKVFRIKGSDVHVTISIGVSTLSDTMKNFNDLMEAADVALYKAKVKRNSIA